MTTHEQNPYGGPYPWRPQQSDPDPETMGPATRERYAREDWRLAQIADATTNRQLAQATPPQGTPRDGIPLEYARPAKPTTPHDPDQPHPHRGTYHPQLRDASGLWEIEEFAWIDPVGHFRLCPWRCQAAGCPESWFPGQYPIKVPLVAKVRFRQGGRYKRNTVFACCPLHRESIERATRMEAIRARLNIGRWFRHGRGE